MKRAIRLTESDLRNIVRRSVGKILREFGSDGPDFADYEVPGYEGTNVPDGLEYNELDANDDFDDFLSDSQYVNQPNIGRHAQSASDFDTDDALLDISSNYDEYGGPRRFGESKKRLGRIIRESIKKVLREGNGNIATYYGSRGALTHGAKMGPGSILGAGVIYLFGNPKGGYPDNMYGGQGYNEIIPVDVDVTNFYRANDVREAQAVARQERDAYDGVIYPSRRDGGEVCAVFNQSCIIGKSSF